MPRTSTEPRHGHGVLQQVNDAKLKAMHEVCDYDTFKDRVRTSHPLPTQHTSISLTHCTLHPSLSRARAVHCRSVGPGA
jgi:hypothetical protein